MGNPNKKPTGTYSDKSDPGKIRQDYVADFLAENNYKVEMLKEGVNGEGNGYGILPNSNPDFIIEGNVFDCYSPTSHSIKTIQPELSKKNKKTSY